MADNKDRPVISQIEAEIEGSIKFFTARPCVNGHIAERRTNDGSCCMCRKIKAAFWYFKNKELSKIRGRYWRDKVNPQRHREWRKEYYETNKADYTAGASARRLAKRRAMPPWVDRKALIKIYRERQRISDVTGIPHHVDHIVPLKGKAVCGLHVPWNLEVIPATENQKKFNRFYDWNNTQIGQRQKMLDENKVLK